MLATPSALDPRPGSRRRLAVLFGLLLAAVVVTGFGGGPSRAATVKSQKASTQIAFASKRDGHDQVYVVKPDGSRLRRLTHNRAADTNPAWSPGGQRIAFESDRGATEDVYLMNADGSHQQRLTRSHAFDGRPNWSPDG